MNSVSALKSPHQAAWYHDKEDDYYAEEGRATSGWRGKLAPQVGNSGRVDRDVCAAALAGKTPEGHYLGRWGQDEYGETEWQHRPGWDSTFSADKSISVMALVGGDDRLIQAHDESVAEALDILESRIGARIKLSDGSITFENTKQMAAAVYRHETSRNQDAQLHSHSLIQNMTQTADGKWRSIDPHVIYTIQRELGDVYQQRMGYKARRLGYTPEKATSENGFTYTKLKEAPDELIDFHSSRRKEIQEGLAKAGLDDSASGAQREAVTLNTRQTKQNVSHAELKQTWEQHAIDNGHDLESIIENAKEVAENTTEAEWQSEEQAANERAVDYAIEHLSERDARFTHQDLMKQAKNFAIGSLATPDGMENVINEKHNNRELVARWTRGYDEEQHEYTQVPGWTTAQGVAAEKAFLSVERQGRGSVDPILNNADAKAAVQAASEASEHGFNRGQFNAAEGLLSTSNRVTAIQGYAGTAKTSSVVATYTATAEANGYSVRGMAPTSRATEELESAGIKQTENTARLLARIKGEPEDIKENEVWLVDEASMLSSNDMRDLTRAAENYDARLVLVGDVQQLGSIQAGESFKQLQDSGMETHTLDQILRQNNDPTREAVESTIDREFENALDAIDRSGHIYEYGPRERQDGSDAEAEQQPESERESKAEQDRSKSMVDEYLDLSKEDREKTLVIDPSRDGRAALNEQIREGLKEEGTLDREEMKITALEKKDMTEAEQKNFNSYDEGDVVRFSKDRKSDGIEAGKEYEVTGHDKDKERVELKDRETGEEASFAPNKTSPRRVQAYEETEIGLSPGDRIRFTENDKQQDRTNGQRATIESIDQERGTATIKSQGKTQELDPSEMGDRAIRHDYASTAHAAQGQTADRVIAHADTERENLLDQRSFYVEVSRAKESISIYTDDREELEKALSSRSGEKDTAMQTEREREHSLARKGYENDPATGDRVPDQEYELATETEDYSMARSDERQDDYRYDDNRRPERDEPAGRRDRDDDREDDRDQWSASDEKRGRDDGYDAYDQEQRPQQEKDKRSKSERAKDEVIKSQVRYLDVGKDERRRDPEKEQEAAKEEEAEKRENAPEKQNDNDNQNERSEEQQQEKASDERNKDNNERDGKQGKKREYRPESSFDKPKEQKQEKDKDRDLGADFGL